MAPVPVVKALKVGRPRPRVENREATKVKPLVVSVAIPKPSNSPDGVAEGLTRVSRSAASSTEDEAARRPRLQQASPALRQLSVQFPGSAWESWDTCRLRVDAESGAGLEMEATQYGYLVDEIDEGAGQESALQPGTVIVCIDGRRLVGLTEPELEDTFGDAFRNGVALELLDWSELRGAEIARESAASGECRCQVPRE